MRALLALLLAGCGGADLCNYADLKTDTCITVHVTGSLNMGEKDFDNVLVDVTYTLGSDEFARRLNPMRITDGGTLNTLPIALGVVYPKLAKPTDSSDRIAVLLTKDNRPVAFGLHRFILDSNSIMIGTHGEVSIEVKPATISNDCFNTLKNSGESDIDCGGGDCPLCASGKKCFGFSSGATTDCASGVCLAISGADDRCQ